MERAFGLEDESSSPEDESFDLEDESFGPEGESSSPEGESFGPEDESFGLEGRLQPLADCSKMIVTDLIFTRESMSSTAIDPRYPIGHCKTPDVITAADIENAIATIAGAPARYREAVKGLSEAQIDTPYREGGWTVRQLIHHVADSHMNALIRVHLALTEDWPTIKPYKEAAWAKLRDYTGPVECSLGILENLHARWAMLLRSLDEGQWKRGFVHPERGRSNLEAATLLYEWHSEHHLAHIMGLKRREGW